MAGPGGVTLPFVSVGEAAAIWEVVARCGMERGLVSLAAGGGDAGADSHNSATKTILGEEQARIAYLMDSHLLLRKQSI